MLDPFRLLLITTSIVFPILSQAELPEGFFVGGSIGQSSFELDETNDSDGDTQGVFFDESSLGFGGHMGYSMSTGLLFDVGYKSLFDGGDQIGNDYEREAEILATTIGIKTFLPINQGWGMLLSFGLGLYDVEYRLKEAGEADEVFGEKSNGYYYGAGLSYDMSEDMWLSLSLENHNFDDDTWKNGKVKANITDISMKLYYLF